MDVRRRKNRSHDNNTEKQCQSGNFDCDSANTIFNDDISQNELKSIERLTTARNDEDPKFFNSDKEKSGKEFSDPLIAQNAQKRITISLEFDVVAVLLMIAGLLTRLYKLEEPRSIVFDELHYGKYVGLYMSRTFFFDSHPPLGKQLIAAAAYLAGFDGDFKFDRIGSPYTERVPLFALRIVPAFFGSLVLPTAYHLALELGLKPWSAAIAGIMLLLDNALLTQSRFILMESMLIQFSLFGLLCVLKFRRVMDKPATISWWIWLTLGIASLTCALCVKYVGFYSLTLGLGIVARDYWSLISRKSFTTSRLWLHAFLRIFTIAFVAATIYLTIFYAHLSLLTRAGPHDSAMTSAFQASLDGGLASITKGQPSIVTHGSQITLRHSHGRACWLHSHGHVYPLRYDDSRGSSHQQQVTCYSFKDVNNWWIVKLPNIDDLVVTRPIVSLKHGDIVQLVHGITSRALNSHDVAAPMTPQSQEVSCYIDYNVSMPAQNLWKIDIINRENDDDTWYAIQSQIRLIHVGTNLGLKFSGRQLPDWGFNQHEIVADRTIERSNAVWNVEEHRYTRSEDAKQRERELINAEMIPLGATSLTFFEKFVELQMKMILGGQDGHSSHMYSSGPTEWPLMTRGIAYWVAADSNAQVHLLGNMAIWYSGTIGLAIYLVLLTFYLLRRRRMCHDIPETEWKRFVNNGQVLLSGYALHYLPFVFVERTLFLHHYLPAFVFKVLLTAATMDHLYYLIRNHNRRRFAVPVAKLFIIGWIVVIFLVFRKFAVLSYGTTPLTANEIVKLRWSDTWDFIIHKT